MTKYINLFILILTLSACEQRVNKKKTPESVKIITEKSERQIKPEKEEKWTDDNGNVIIQKGNEVSIIPAKYEKTGKTYMVFVFNETSIEIQVSERLKIQPNEFKVFHMVDTDTLELNNGVKFMFGETYGLEIEDKKSQVSGLGGEFLRKYGVPDEAEWAFVIVPEGKGD